MFLLEKGQIEKVIVFNKVEAEVFLKPESLKLKEHSKVAKIF
jgi:cell division protease FtsH